MQPSGGLILNERSREILRKAIAAFVATGKPVGSRMIARRIRERLSPATVRSIMAELEEMGYLLQPHASAGRIPADKPRGIEAHPVCQADREPGSGGVDFEGWHRSEPGYLPGGRLFSD